MAPPGVSSVEGVAESLSSVSLAEESSSATSPRMDPYRSFLQGDSEKHTAWRHGGPPEYVAVNRTFEEGRTQIWEEGSLERIVENLVKTWEMELSHKTRLSDHKTIDSAKFSMSVNGGPKLSGDEILKAGSYNVLLASTLPGEHEAYKASVESFDSSHDIFRSVFPDGFAWEVLAVYSGPPAVAFKFRHWGIMKGAFKGHAPTNEIAESFGMCIASVDDKLLITALEIFYDPTQFLAALTKGTKSAEYLEYKKGVEGCPFLTSQRSNLQVV